MEMMSLLTEIMDYNKEFIEKKLYEEYKTNKFPNKRLVILTCMDTRLVELLHKAMNMKNGDVKVVKTAGAIVKNPFGSIMRSLLISVYELQADEVYIIGHHDCGMSAVDSQEMLKKMLERGISADTIDIVENAGINLDQWLEGFDSVEESVEHSVDMVRNHPLMSGDIPIHGLVIDPSTGKLDLVVDGYKHTK